MSYILDHNSYVILFSKRNSAPDIVYSSDIDNVVGEVA